MPVPEIKVEVAFTAGFATPAASRVWVDVSQWIEGDESIPISYGRSDERSAVDPGRISFTLDNRDGRFTPDRESSPHHPYVTKSRPVRLMLRYDDGAWSQRGLWYTDEWSLEWPDGSDGACVVNVAASSRRARLGQTAPLPSAVREAILATSPQAYWPMTEDADVTDASQRQAFRDVTNPASTRDKQALGTFSRDLAWGPVVHDGTQGPPDEESLVFFPGERSLGQLPTLSRYIGAAGAFKVGPAEFTLEFLAYLPVRYDRNVYALPVQLSSSDGSEIVELVVATDIASDAQGIYPQMTYRLEDNTLTFGDLASGNDQTTFARATDAEMHHFAITLTGGKTAQVWVDGQPGLSNTLTDGRSYPRPFTSIILGGAVVNSDLWIGHVAIHDRALTASELVLRADATTTSDETLDGRVKRVAGYVGVPADEVVVETSVAPLLGLQSQAGRSAVEVIDEIAASSGGVAYDDRLGNLALQARNHRYNAPPSFSLNSEGQEVQADLNFQLDDRYLVNSVEASQVGSSDLPLLVEDAASIAAFGVYSQSLSVVTSSTNEVQSAASNAIYRSASPRARVTQVSVDVTAIPAAQRAKVLAADIGTRIELTALPGQAPASTLTLFVEGYEESLSATTHVITFNTTPGDLDAAWVLDSPSLSVLDTSTLVAY